MIDFRHLPNAPIREALIDFRIRSEEPPSLDMLARLNELLRAAYPTQSTLQTGTWQLTIKEGASLAETAIGHSTIGYRLTSADEKQVLQIRVDGLTFSRLAPYTQWEDVRGEAAKSWRHYVDVVKPRQVIRTAVRYINRIEIPLPIRDLAEYVTTQPVMPQHYPQAMRGFLTRLVLEEPDDDRVRAIVTQSTDRSVESKYPIILDIDVFDTTSYECAGDEYWDALERLRGLKNRIFFSTITDKCAELFK
jgi:uncharacterized protein (TIGR04255 family)